jgi:hypothetical protein
MLEGVATILGLLPLGCCTEALDRYTPSPYGQSGSLV